MGEGAETSRGGANLLFFKIFAKNCMKMKEIVMKGVEHPQGVFGSTTVIIYKFNSKYFHNEIRHFGTQVHLFVDLLITDIVNCTNYS